MIPKPISATSLKRIQREAADLEKEELEFIHLEPSEEDICLWRGNIKGPEGSVYEGGIFDFEIQLPPDYPFSAPKIIFKTRIYHMNISEHGNICIDILKHNWSPALSLFKVMLSLSSLLTDPNPKDPLVPSIATQYRRNRHLHDSTARQWTMMYARSNAVPHVTPSAKAKGSRRSTNCETIIVDDSDEDGTISRKRKRLQFNADAANLENDTGQANAKKREVKNGSGLAQAGEVPRKPGDVIVIEDD